MLTIIVCIKQVYDPEAPLSLFQLGPDGRSLLPPPGTPPVLSPFDENALEAALRIKEEQGARVVALSMGHKLAKPVLKKALAAGADDLICLDDATFDGLDSYGTSLVLAKAIERIGGADLVLCGRQAADTDAGQVGPTLAECLGIPGVTLARKVELLPESVRVERILADGYEVVEGALPMLITVSQEVGELRFPPVKAVLAAQKKPITVWNAEELGLSGAIVRRAELVRLYVPERESLCEMIGGENPEQVADGLAAVLETRLG